MAHIHKPFNSIKMATIAEIKATIGITGSMPLVEQFETQKIDGVDTEVKTVWVAYWNEKPRFRVVMHESIMAEIRASNLTKADLALKTKHVPAETKTVDGVPTVREAYTRYVVITPNHVADVF